MDIGNKALVKLGGNSYINPIYGLEIGKNCAISWGCQFLDEDFHDITNEGKSKFSQPKNIIKDKVWIGSRTSIYKGTIIPQGSVIAANSVVKGIFKEENTLIAGSPSKVIKKNVSWN